MKINFFKEMNNLSKKDKKFKQQNLISAIYYDEDWWQKSIALEWWQKNGHFNDILYREVLFAKLNRT